MNLAAVVILSTLVQVPEEKKQDEFPKWTVSGLLSTDINALHSTPPARNSMPEEGISGQFELGGDLHLSRGMSVTLRSCVGCHGFQVQSAFVDVQLSEAFTLRAGRLPVPFGAFSDRVRPSHMESTSKPLPYIMGRMVREKEFNLGIVPAPLSDNGAQLTGEWWVAGAKVGVEAALIRGLKGSGPDFDYIVTRDFPDDNGQPAGSARLTATAGPVSLGASGMFGRYDPDGKLDYAMAGADLQLRFGSWNLRMEGLARDTDFLDAASEKDTSRRLGYAAQVDAAVAEDWRVFVLQDGLKVGGLFLGPGGPTVFSLPGTTDDSNSILRLVGGIVWSPKPGLQVKASAEYWDFSDFPDTRVFHLEIVAEY